MFLKSWAEEQQRRRVGSKQFSDANISRPLKKKKLFDPETSKMQGVFRGGSKEQCATANSCKVSFTSIDLSERCKVCCERQIILRQKNNAVRLNYKDLVDIVKTLREKKNDCLSHGKVETTITSL